VRRGRGQCRRGLAICLQTDSVRQHQLQASVAVRQTMLRNNFTSYSLPQERSEIRRTAQISEMAIFKVPQSFFRREQAPLYETLLVGRWVGWLVSLSVRPSVRPSVHPSVRPSVRLSVCPSVRPSVRPSVPILLTSKLLRPRRAM
jgi:hypothetical protein